MLCVKCSAKSIAKGIKQIKCFCCGEDSIVNVLATDICTGCAEMNGLCELCGETIKKEDE